MKKVITKIKIQKKVPFHRRNIKLIGWYETSKRWKRSTWRVRVPEHLIDSIRDLWEGEEADKNLALAWIGKYYKKTNTLTYFPDGYITLNKPIHSYEFVVMDFGTGKIKNL